MCTELFVVVKNGILWAAGGVAQVVECLSSVH
jgi:hypothetical protein